MKMCVYEEAKRVREALQDDGAYRPLGAYHGNQFPLQRIKGSNWAVVGECWSAWNVQKRHLTEIDIHFDDDDPNHIFLGPEAWSGWPNAKKLSEWYNARFRKNIRMAERRAASFTKEQAARIDNQFIASDAIRLSAMICHAPNDEHQYGRLDWNPTTQVWKDGKKWVKVRPSDILIGV